MAARFFVNGGVNNLWSSTTNWSTTSGGAGGSSVPAATDDVTLDANSPNCTVDEGAVRNTLTFTTTNYTNTLTLNGVLRCTSTVTLGSSMQPILGNGAFRWEGTFNVTTNGISIPNLGIINTSTLTFNDAVTVNNVFSVTGTGTITLNGNSMTVKGFIFISVIINSAFPTVQGTTIINLNNYNGDYTLVGTLSNTLNIQKPTRGY